MTASDASDANHQGLPEPIPMRVLFGNADKRMARISPNGKFLAFLADDTEGVTNVFVQPVQFEAGGAEDAVLLDTPPQQVTHENHRPVPFFVWAESTERLRLLYFQDSHGDENFHIHCADFDMDPTTHTVQNLSVRDLTPFEKTTVMGIDTDKNFPDTIYAQLNKRDATVFDVFRIDIPSGNVELAIQNPGDILLWILNDKFEIMGAQAMNPVDGGASLRIRPSLDNTDAATWNTIGVWPHGESVGVHSFNKDGSGLYVETSMTHNDSGETINTSRLVLLSVENGKELEVIAQDDKADVSTVSFDKVARTPRFAVFEYTKPRVEVIDEALRSDIEKLVALCKGAFKLESVSADNDRWIYGDERDDASLKYYIYERSSGRHAMLFDSRAALAKYTLVNMVPHVIKTSDGEDMVIYMSLPHGVKAEKLPFVLYVHGGPWARDTWGYESTHQFLANRGYGCISVNFRGSTGLGKRWTNLGDKEWAGTMQQDLTDTVEWAIKQGYADKEKFAIYGGSYGGYATLAGLAFTPDLYTCGVDVVGPSNVDTLFKSIPPYWSTMKRMLELRVGDVENDEELNQRISPLFHADKMHKPLMIAQGANDPRVKQAESDQIAKKLYENKHEVNYVLYTDEGHGFRRPQNRLDFVFRVEEFFAEHLGGRKFEKDLELIKGTTATVIDPATL